MDPEAHVDKGESARFSSFMGAIAIADLVKTTLGPKGMDKILQSVSNPSGDIMVTNDGATILRSIVVDNPAAKVLIDIAKTQDDEVSRTTALPFRCFFSTCAPASPYPIPAAPILPRHPSSSPSSRSATALRQ